MILHFMKCDVCDKTHRFEPMMGPAWSQMPHDWLVLMTGDRGEDGRLFCSTACLKEHFGVGEPVQPLEQPQSKMRRFVLVDGETAEEYEGVVFSSGVVTINVNKEKQQIFTDWKHFKDDNPGCGITWIDQEVKEEVFA